MPYDPALRGQRFSNKGYTRRLWFVTLDDPPNVHLVIYLLNPDRTSQSAIYRQQHVPHAEDGALGARVLGISKPVS